MNRKDCLDVYQYHSTRASESVRQLALGALAIVWIFRPPTIDGPIAMPRPLLWAGLFAALALALDLMQSLYGTIAWGKFHRRKELEGLSLESAFRAPRTINWPTTGLFALKVASLVLSYVTVIVYLSRRLVGTPQT